MQFLVIKTHLYEDRLAEIEYVFCHNVSSFSTSMANTYEYLYSTYVSDSSQLIVISVFLVLTFIFGFFILKRNQVKRSEIFRYEDGIKVDGNFSLGKDKEIC